MSDDLKRIIMSPEFCEAFAGPPRIGIPLSELTADYIMRISKAEDRFAKEKIKAVGWFSEKKRWQ